MQRISDIMRKMGADDNTVQFTLKVAVVCIALFGLAALGVDIFEIVTKQTVSGWASVIVGAVAFFFTTTFTQAHTANAINGTATKTATVQAQNTIQPLIDSNSQLSQQQVQLLAQVLAQMQAMQANTTAMQANTQAITQSNASNTSAIDKNTEATQQNTEVEKHAG